VLCDVKLHNGYVVGPGSIHPTGKALRRVVNDAEIAEAPNWLRNVDIKNSTNTAKADEQQYGAK